ncbi:MAG: transcription antitermination factor NusB [Propionibacteriaceae bacterium]|nr:transcription antitermination factor NusB [Propionibacteriaceae bacterium]
MPGSRTKARKAAADILFEIDLRGNDVTEALETHAEDAEAPLRPYTEELVAGVVTNLDRLDAMIAAALADGWSLSRMPGVDRALARVAAYEIAFGGVDRNIAISEAVALAGQLSTDESPAFLNGLLASL